MNEKSDALVSSIKKTMEDLVTNLPDNMLIGIAATDATTLGVIRQYYHKNNNNLYRGLLELISTKYQLSDSQKSELVQRIISENQPYFERFGFL